MARYRFGPFELDQARWQLSRGGAPVRLEKRTLQLLGLLLERAGEVVPRAALAARLWPDVTVDAEQGLNTLASKLRRALGEGGDGARLATVVGAGYRLDGPVTRERPAPRLAVRAFQGLPGGAGTQALGEGLAEVLRVQLARRPGLQLLAPAAEGAEVVVEGVVLRAEKGELRLTARLEEVASGRTLWAEEYRRRPGDAWAVVDEVAANVAGRVELALAPGAAPVASGGTVEPRAFEAWVAGRAAWRKRGAAALREAVACFRRATELDPGFAAAWAGEAGALATLGAFTFEAPGPAFTAAEAAAARALALDPGLAQAHAALGYVRLYHRWDASGAEAALEEAVRRGPGEPGAHHWASVLSTALGRHEEAALQLARALELDPLSDALRTDQGFELYYAGQVAEALACLEAVLREAPDFGPAHLWLGRTLQRAGRAEEAVAAFDRAPAAFAGWPVLVAARAHAAGEAGRPEEVRAALERLRTRAASEHVTPYALALCHLAAGEAEAALRELDRAVAGRSPWVVWLWQDPRLAALRGSGRLEALVRRVGLGPG